jgi:CRP-like cAMP-binding protein
MARGVPAQVLDMLSSVPLFSGCSKQELRAIAGLGTRVDVKEGTVLTRESTPGAELFLVMTGKAHCEVGGKVVANFGAGDFFGEMSLLDGSIRTATVVADTPAEVLVLDRREFRGLIDASPSIAWKMLAAMAERLRRADYAITH